MTATDPKRQHPRRAQVLRLLREAPEPLGVADVAAQLGIHANTARFHLDALTAAGSVIRRLDEPSGPGRPRTVYAPRPGMDRGGDRAYRLLAEILLSHLSADGAGAERAATQAGRAWGGFLVDRPPPGRRVSATEATTRLMTLLSELDFAPEAGAERPVPETIRLRHCPFLELAEGYGPLVCRMHLELMRGALAELRAPLEVTRLEPFAESDACLTRLRHKPAA